MTRNTGARLSRACMRCRQRKTKCDLKHTSESGYHSCSKCISDGCRCTIASSRRGGDYSRFRNRQKQTGRAARSEMLDNKGFPDKLSPKNPVTDGLDQGICGGIQNPLEALQILAQTASSERDAAFGSTGKSSAAERGAQNQRHTHSNRQINNLSTLMAPELVKECVVEVNLLQPLLQYYARNYHQYLPIVPHHLLDYNRFGQAWADEPFLLTAVLLIATQDRPELGMLHTKLLKYMEKALLRVVLGAPSVRHVGSIEGLLILAEWVPRISPGGTSREESSDGAILENNETAAEDSVAWNLIGIAVRQAYLLHLEKHSFRSEVKTEPESICNRKRLAWIFTYLADRQISIQMGQAFWCRGPGLSTRFTTHDYPSLTPQHTGGIDYASFVQAQVDLTTLFGNIHDILYASKSRTVQLMLMGDYTKYLDDSAKSLDMWREQWRALDIPPHLSGLLTLQFEYLRLYINAFAFQAVLYRLRKDTTNASGQEGQQETASYFPYSVMASPDGRHIYISIDAAKNVLRTLIERIDPSKHLRFLPVKYYLFEIHASVFLFEAHTVGALTKDEHQACSSLVRRFISMLRTAASAPNNRHIASRYEKLLSCLWFRSNGYQAPSNIREPSSARSKSNPAYNNNNDNDHTEQTSLTPSTTRVAQLQGRVQPQQHSTLPPIADSHPQNCSANNPDEIPITPLIPDMFPDQNQDQDQDQDQMNISLDGPESGTLLDTNTNTNIYPLPSPYSSSLFDNTDIDTYHGSDPFALASIPNVPFLRGGFPLFSLDSDLDGDYLAWDSFVGNVG